jgi:beta-galactosidase
VIADRQLFCGEMHYPRIPREYWRARLELAYAMGLDAISTYVFWNLHEPRPQHYDFAEGNDVAEFVRLAAACGLDVVLRPGPYVCAEWDLGGLPAWLLADPAMRLRTANEAYMAPVRRWLKRLGEELAPLQRSRDGPIIAVQLENEYGAFGDDAAYLESLRAALDAAGFADSPYYTIDQPGDIARGALADLPIASTFAPGDPQRDLAILRELRPDQRPICGEYWAGWFDHWGEPHQQRDDAQQARDLEWMAANDCSFNIYMLHGGTNFGFTNGANVSEREPYAPVTTSYDYLAAIDEAGHPRAKYYAFREALAKMRNVQPRALPPIPAAIEVSGFELTHAAPLAALLRHPIERERPATMEELGQSFGFILYRTAIADASAGWLEIGEPRDYATVMLDGAVCGTLDRRVGSASLRLERHRAGATLDILIENCGRVNYGPLVGGERKGLDSPPRFNGNELLGWQIFALPLDDVRSLPFSDARHAAPAFLRGTFELEEPHDTFLETVQLGKGVLFINGRNVGRYWSVGPQNALYVPGAWLHRGTNEVVVFETAGAQKPYIKGSKGPIDVRLTK